MINILEEVALNNHIVEELGDTQFVSEESVQYWNLLLSPLPAAKHAFHLPSDQ